MIEAALGFAALFVLMSLRVPIAFSMAAVGLAGIGLMRSWPAAFSSTRHRDPRHRQVHLVGGAAVRADGELRQRVRACRASCIRPPIPSSGIGAAGWPCPRSWPVPASGRSAAPRSPPLRPWRAWRCRRCAGSTTSESFAAGAIAAGGTLGILIPPSVIMVIYGIMTEQSIGALFAAGILPGLVATAFYMTAAGIVTARNPSSSGRPASAWTGPGRVAALKEHLGRRRAVRCRAGRDVRRLVHPTEAAGIGATGGFLFALLRGKLDLRDCAGAGGFGPYHGDAVHHPDRGDRSSPTS